MANKGIRARRRKSQQGNQGKEKGNCQLRNQGKKEENSHKKYNQWKEKENMVNTGTQK